jgi:hypothetical protein
MASSCCRFDELWSNFKPRYNLADYVFENCFFFDVELH